MQEGSYPPFGRLHSCCAALTCLANSEKLGLVVPCASDVRENVTDAINSSNVKPAAPRERGEKEKKQTIRNVRKLIKSGAPVNQNFRKSARVLPTKTRSELFFLRASVDYFDYRLGYRRHEKLQRMCSDEKIARPIRERGAHQTHKLRNCIIQARI